jgi:hypothetical protein
VAGQVTFPTRPTRGSPLQQQIDTVWAMLLYFANIIFAPAVVTMVSGTVTVPGAANAVLVTHNLGALPYAAVVTPVGDPGGYWATSGPFWVSAKLANSFILNIPAPAPVGGLTFDWMVR